MVIRDEHVVPLSFKMSEGLESIFSRINRVTGVMYDFTDDVAGTGIVFGN